MRGRNPDSQALEVILGSSRSCNSGTDLVMCPIRHSLHIRYIWHKDEYSLDNSYILLYNVGERS